MASLIERVECPTLNPLSHNRYKDLVHHLRQVRRNFGALLMQEHDVNVAERIELAPAISAKSNQRQGHLSFTISTSRRGRCSAEDVL